MFVNGGIKLEDYYQSLKDELLARQNQLKALTKGLKQPKIKGDYYEALLRDFVSRFIDSSLSVKHGLIFDNKGNSSRECDIIVYDKKKKPWFESGDTVIVNEEYVKAAMQVKATLNSKNLKNSIENLKSVKKLNSHIECWIVAFNTKMLFKTLYLNAAQSRVVQHLIVLSPKKMETETQSLFTNQMKFFVDMIRQIGGKTLYGGTKDFIIYKERKGGVGLILNENVNRNREILRKIYSNNFWEVLHNKQYRSIGYSQPSD
jgi:hypothetical protein